jgi:O-antigen/teichoic acid export membrane protein
MNFFPGPFGAWLQRLGIDWRGERAQRYFRSLQANYLNLPLVFLYTALTVPLGLKCLGPDGWGTWVICLQISTFINLWENFSTGALVRRLVEFKDNRSSPGYAKFFFLGLLTFRAQGALLLLAHLVAGWLAPWLFTKLDPLQTISLMGVLGLGSLVQQLGKISGQCLYMYQRVDWASYASGAGLLAGLLVGCALLSLTSSLTSLAWGSVASALVANLINYGGARSMGLFPDRSSPGPDLKIRDFLGFYSFSAPFFSHAVLSGFYTSLPVFLAGHFLSLQEAGQWGILQRIVNLFNQVSRSITQLSFPFLLEKASTLQMAALKQMACRVLLAQNILAALLAAFFAVAGNRLILLWTGDSFATGWIPFLLGLAILIDMDQRFRFDLDTVVLYVKRALQADILKAALLLALGYIFIPRFSVLGIVFSFLFTSLISLSFACFTQSRKGPTTMPKIPLFVSIFSWIVFFLGATVILGVSFLYENMAF